MEFKDFTLVEKIKMVIIAPWLFISGLIRTLYYGIRFNDWE